MVLQFLAMRVLESGNISRTVAVDDRIQNLTKTSQTWTTNANQDQLWLFIDLLVQHSLNEVSAESGLPSSD